MPHDRDIQLLLCLPMRPYFHFQHFLTIICTPLPRYRKGRIPGLKLLAAIVHWIWPVDRCTNCHSIYSISLSHDLSAKNLDHIHRSADGRFVLGSQHESSFDDIDVVDSAAEISMDVIEPHFHRPNSGADSTNSSSDDGGFLIKTPKRSRHAESSLDFISPSQLSVRFEDPVQQPQQPNYSGGLLSIGGRIPQHLLQTVPIDQHHGVNQHYHRAPVGQNLHINTINSNVPGPMVAVQHHATPSRVSRLVASSPAVSTPLGGIGSPWSPNAMYFSDLSSVQQPSSAERSFPTPQSGISQLRYLQERYSQELPSLRAIHEETKRMAQGFVPLQIQMHSPSWRYTQTPTSSSQHHGYRGGRTRMLPRYARMARSAPDLGSPVSALNIAMHHGIEASPESRSSSSGFGSKNTSTQHNQSSQSGSTHDWRSLPPYRPPPPPPSVYPTYNPYHYPAQTATLLQQHYHQPEQHQQQSLHDQTPYTMGHWLELITRLNAASENVVIPKAVDVGSVDGHYEFDPNTPTPTASTPTGPRDIDTVDSFAAHPSSMLHHHHNHNHKSQLHQSNLSPGLANTQLTLSSRKTRPSKYENIEARVQAMKDEFYAYRKRQQMRQHSGVELESAC